MMNNDHDFVFLFSRFFAINTLIVYVYMNTFQRIDEEEYGGLSELLKEGLMTSFSSFLVSSIFDVIFICPW